MIREFLLMCSVLVILPISLVLIVALLPIIFLYRLTKEAWQTSNEIFDQLEEKIEESMHPGIAREEKNGRQ